MKNISNITLKYFFTLLSLLCLTGIPGIAKGAGLEISPSKLSLKYPNTQKTELRTGNSGQKAQNFQVYADDFPSRLQISPEDFSLAPGETKTISISFKSAADLFSYQTNISVLSFGIGNNETSVGAGIKIPLNVEVLNEMQVPAPKYPTTISLVLSVLALLALAWPNYKKIFKSKL